MTSSLRQNKLSTKIPRPVAAEDFVDHFELLWEFTEMNLRSIKMTRLIRRGSFQVKNLLF